MRRFLPALMCAGLLSMAPPALADTQAPAAPTADQLRAATQNCAEQLSDGEYAHDDGGAATVPVCAGANAVYWTADMDIDCDGQRTEQCNEDTDPWFQPETAFVESDGDPLNSAELPFIVVPLPSGSWDYADAGIGGGTVAAVAYEDKVAYAVVGDLGPDGAIGEGSYELAEQLGIDPDPSTGGASGATVTYVLFPGIEASPIEDASQSASLGAAAAADFVDAVPGCASVSLDFASYPWLSAGESGDRVKAAQCLLRSQDFPTGGEEPSGTLDPATVDAVTAFQTDRGLQASGAINAHTWTALLSSGGTPTLSEGSTGSDVRRLQRALTAALRATVVIDGDFGPQTDQAVRDYQTATGLIVDGIVGDQTWGALHAGTM